MQCWHLRFPSEFAELMDEKHYFQKMSVVQTIPDENRDKAAVNHVFHRLNARRAFFSGLSEEAVVFDQLISFVSGLYETIPVFSEEDQFQVLQPLRTWLFFLPINFLGRRGRSEVHSMVLLAHFYAVALAIEPLFPAVGAAYLGTMSVGPIQQIDRNLQSYFHTSTIERQGIFKEALDLMDFPREMVDEFERRMGHISIAAQISVSSPPPTRLPIVVNPHMDHRSALYSHSSSPQDLNSYWQPYTSVAATTDGINNAAYPISPYDRDRSQPATNYITQTMWNPMR